MSRVCIQVLCVSRAITSAMDHVSDRSVVVLMIVGIIRVVRSFDKRIPWST